MSTFAFDASFQRAVLRLCMVDDAFCISAMRHLEAEHFSTEAHGWIFSMLKRYWSAYQMRCEDMPLQNAVAMASPEKQALYAFEVSQIVALGLVPDRAYIQEQLTEFLRRSIFAVAHGEAAQHFNDGKIKESYEVMALAQERMQKVQFDKIDRQWFFEEVNDRYRARVRQQLDLLDVPFSTGIPELDEMTEGGLHRGELWAMLAYAKRCKTTFLINQGFLAVRVLRQPTLHFVLEGKGEQTAARYDAAFMNELYAHVKKGEVNAQTMRYFHQEAEQAKRLLVIRTLNDWDISVLDLQSEIRELKGHNFAPALVVVDYMDLLRSRSRASSEMEHQVNSARDLKRLVNNEGFACWSAWQAQRPDKAAHDTEHILTSSNVADCYAKVRIVDGWGSLNATDEEMKRNEMRIFYEAHRDHAIGKVWKVENDLSRMRMITSSYEYTPPATSSRSQRGQDVGVTDSREHSHRSTRSSSQSATGGYKESASKKSHEYLMNCRAPGCGSERLRWRHDPAGNQRWICWGCKRSGDTLKLIMQQENIEMEEAMVRLLENYTGGDLPSTLTGVQQAATKRLGVLPRVPWPQGAEALTDCSAHAGVWRYATQVRGLTPEQIRDYCLCVGRQGRLTNYIIFPVIMDGGLVYWQGRAAWDPPGELDPVGRKEWIRQTHYIKTLNPTAVEGCATAGDVLFNHDRARAFDHVVICEGPIDAIRVGPQAVALFGKAWSEQKLSRLLRLPARRYTVYLDRGAAERASAESLCVELMNYAPTYLAEPPEGFDPGNLTPEQNAKVIEAAPLFSGLRLKSVAG